MKYYPIHTHLHRAHEASASIGSYMSHIKALGFKGIILSPPYDRTLKTASIIAEILDLTVTPVAWLHAIQLHPDIFLYGHGLTGETRTPEDNIRGKKQFFNAVWGAFVHDFENDVHVMIPRAHL